jgi:hypothetical protein
MGYIGSGVQRFNTADGLTVTGSAEINSLTYPTADGSNGQVLKTNGSGTLSFGTVSTDLVNDTSPQLGGDLQSNGNDIVIADTDNIYVGTSNDGLKIHHSNNNSFIEDVGTGNFLITTNGNNIQLMKNQAEQMLVAKTDGSVELYYDNSLKLDTQSHGARVNGGLRFASSGAASDTSNPYIFRTSGADDMVFATGSAERMRLTSAGLLGLGVTAPDGKLNVVSTAHNNGSIFDSTGTTQLWLRDTDAASNQKNWGFQVSGGDLNIVRANDDRASGFVTPIYIQQAPANSLVIDASGNVGIGTASPDALLQIEKSDSGTTIDKEPSSQSGPNIAIHNSNQTANNLSSIQFTNRGTNGVAETATAGIHVKHEAQGGTYSYGSMNFNVTNSAGSYATRMHISSDGNVGIGTASPTSASGGKVLAVETTADEHTNLVFNTANTGRNGIIEGRRTGRSGTERFAQINIQNNSDGGEIRFYTAGSASDVSERARFDDSANFLVGATSLNDTNGFTVFPTGSGSATMVRIDRNSNGTALQFRQGQSAIGTVSTTTSGVTYNTTSDIRLKQDIEPLQATDKLMAMNPVSYSWKVDPDGPRSMGFIAQEMEEVMPEAVSTGDDEDAMMSMDYGRITPILVSALQDAHKKIEQLESRLAAMETANE